MDSSMIGRGVRFYSASLGDRKGYLLRALEELKKMQVRRAGFLLLHAPHLTLLRFT
jgi:hypothetical protein